MENDILHANENMARLEREMQEAAESGRGTDAEIAEKRAQIEEKNQQAGQVQEGAASGVDLSHVTDLQETAQLARPVGQVQLPVL